MRTGIERRRLHTFTCARERVLLLAASAAIGWAASDALSQTTTWTNATGNGLWNDPANWTGGVPTAGHRALLRATGSITLPADNSAVANFIETDFPTGPSPGWEVDGGRLTTNYLSHFFSQTPFTLRSDIGSPGEVLVIRNITTTGTIGDGTLGGGTFDLLALSSRLRGPSTTTGQVALNFSRIEQAGSVAPASDVVWSGSSTLTISSGFANVDRLPDAGDLRLVSAIFRVESTADTAVSERVGTMRLDPGRQTLWLISPASGSLTITADGLARQRGAVLQLTRSDTSRLRFVNSPTGANGPSPTDRAILGYGFDHVSDGATLRPSFVTYDTGADPASIDDDPGLRGLAWDEYSTTIAAGGNVRLTGSNALASDASVRSLNLVDGSLTLNAASLSIHSGLMLQGEAAGAAVGGSGAIAFPGEAVILAFGTPKQIDVPIHAPSLTSGGDDTLVLTRDNAFPAGVHVGSGRLISRSSGSLGSGPVRIGSGARLTIEQQSTTIDQLVLPGLVKQTSAGDFRLGGFQTVLETGPAVTVTVQAAAGAGPLSLEGTGIVHFPPGSQSGLDLFVYGGELRIDGTVGVFGSDRHSVVLFGGTVTGSGSVSGSLSGVDFRGGVIAPGPGPARITTDVFSFGSLIQPQTPHVLQLDLKGTDGDAHDQIRAMQTVFLRDLVLDLSVNYAAQIGDAFMIIDNQGLSPVFPVPSNLPEGALLFDDGYQFRITYRGGTGNDVVLTVVPEPLGAGAAMMAAGALLMRRRRR